MCFRLAGVSVNIVKLAAGLFTLGAKLAGESVLQYMEPIEHLLMCTRSLHVN